MIHEAEPALRPRWHRHLALGLSLAAAAWIGEGFVHALMDDQPGVTGLLWPTDSHELWMRGLISGLILTCTARGVRDIRELELLRVEGERLHRELDVALTHALAGFIPVCSGCKGIRREDGDWEQMESYLAKRTDAEFTHGLCPSCREQLYPGIPRAPVAEPRVSPRPC